jgi:cell division protein FtsW (lipid II flippase)
MIDSLATFSSAGYIADLNSVYVSLAQHYLGPAVLLILAFFAVKAFVGKDVRQLISVIVMAIIAAVIIYAAPSLFSQNSTLVKNGGEIAKQVN